MITSGARRCFCCSWIPLQGEYARAGGSFGNTLPLDLAWFGRFACLVPLFAAISLARGAYQLPGAWIR